MNWQQPIPRSYTQLPTDELVRRIAAHKNRLADQLGILGHHYQQDAVIRFADVSGDSLQLSRKAAAKLRVGYVIFCGVHFMAEIRRHPHRRSANRSSSRTWAPAAPWPTWPDIDDAEDRPVLGSPPPPAICPDQTIIPITYINCTAAIKSLRRRTRRRRLHQQQLPKGAPDGLWVAAPPRRWKAAERTPRLRKILFFPDQHLGRNTAYAMGHPLRPHGHMGPQTTGTPGDDGRPGDPRRRLCPVGRATAPSTSSSGRSMSIRPGPSIRGIKVIVHPECSLQRRPESRPGRQHRPTSAGPIEAAPPGSQWAVGTEVHLVNRLAQTSTRSKIMVA